MKGKVLISSLISGVVILGGLLLYSQNLNNMKSKLTVQPIGDKGIFVGEASKGQIDFSSYDHQKAIRAIDEAELYIRSGNDAYQAGQYEEAAKAYNKAYLIDKGGRAVSGLKLAMTYEKLGRYDEGIALLNEMITKGYLSDKGIQNANEIKSRLLAAKAAQQSTNSQTQ